MIACFKECHLFGHCLNAHSIHMSPCPHAGLLVGQAKPSKQNHTAMSKKEMNSGWWLQNLKPWTADFPLKRVPSCLSPRHPVTPWPVPPTHSTCAQPGQLVGSWVAALKWEYCLLYLFVCRKIVFIQTSSPFSVLWMRSPKDKAGQPGLQTPHMTQSWFPNPASPPYTLRNRGNVCLPSSFLLHMGGQC
jgi:hypothetical protein